MGLGSVDSGHVVQSLGDRLGRWFCPTFLPRLIPLLGGCLELGIVERRLDVGLGAVSSGAGVWE